MNNIFYLFLPIGKTSHACCNFSDFFFFFFPDSPLVSVFDFWWKDACSGTELLNICKDIDASLHMQLEILLLLI